MLSLGAAFFPSDHPAATLELGERAVDMGYRSLWFGDSQLIWREAFVLLGAAAARLPGVSLATGVTNPVLRDVTVVASAAATLQQLTGGRFSLGIGKGDSAMATAGRAPSSTEELVAAVHNIGRLTRGEAVRMVGEPVQLAYATPATAVPLLIAAAGPKMLRVAGRVADGAIVPLRFDADFFAMARQEISAGLSEASGNTRDFRTVFWVPCAVAREEEEALDAVRAHVARILMRTPASVLHPEYRDRPALARQRYDYHRHMVAGTDHGAVVPDALIDTFAIAGTPERCWRQLQRLIEFGVREVVIVPHGLDYQAREQTLRLFAEVAKRAGSLAETQ